MGRASELVGQLGRPRRGRARARLRSRTSAARANLMTSASGSSAGSSPRPLQAGQRRERQREVVREAIAARCRRAAPAARDSRMRRAVERRSVPRLGRLGARRPASARPAVAASPRAASSAGREVEARARRRLQRLQLGHRSRGRARVVERQHRRVAASAAPRRDRPSCRAPARRRRSCRSCRPSCATTTGSPALPTSRSIVRDELRVLLRQPRERHERRGHARRPRTTGRPRARSAAPRPRWPVTSATTVSAKAAASSVAWKHGVVGGAPGAGRVHVEVDDAALVRARARRGPRTRPSPRSARASARTRRPGGARAAGASRRAASSRATSSMVALARAVVHRAVVPGVDVAGEEEEAVLAAPRQVARPGAGSASSPCARGSSSRTRSGPAASRARSRSPSAPRIDRHGQWSGSATPSPAPGVPQIVVTIMLWRWSMRTWTLAEHARLLRRPRLARRGAVRRTSASLPRRARARSSGRPSPTSTSSASSPSTEVENEWVSPPMHDAVGQGEAGLQRAG